MRKPKKRDEHVASTGNSDRAAKTARDRESAAASTRKQEKPQAEGRGRKENGANGPPLSVSGCGMWPHTTVSAILVGWHGCDGMEIGGTRQLVNGDLSLLWQELTRPGILYTTVVHTCCSMDCSRWVALQLWHE